VDVSIGEKVAGYGTQMGRLDVMCQNPSNAVVALGHSGGGFVVVFLSGHTTNLLVALF